MIQAIKRGYYFRVGKGALAESHGLKRENVADLNSKTFKILRESYTLARWRSIRSIWKNWIVYKFLMTDKKSKKVSSLFVEYPFCKIGGRNLSFFPIIANRLSKFKSDL